MSNSKQSKADASQPAHDETHPHRGFIGMAAKLVETYCLLPEPPQHSFNAIKGFLKSLSHPRNYLSEKTCVKRQIDAQAMQAHIEPPQIGSPDYEHILAHARAFAKVDGAHCLMRNYEDVSEVPKDYYGYRGIDNQCHATLVPEDAKRNRCLFEQDSRNTMFLPTAPKQLGKNGRCAP